MNGTLALQRGVKELGEALLSCPQVELPVRHRFKDGWYIREITIPSGVCVVGRAHKSPHICFLAKGSLIIPTSEGCARIDAPLAFVSKPGQKAAVSVGEVVFQNFYQTDETDIEKLEDIFLEKSEALNAYRTDKESLSVAEHKADMNDLKEVMDTYISLDTSEQSPPDLSEWNLVPRASPIHGKGLFLSYPVEKWQVIAPVRLSGVLSGVSRFVNHGKIPNAFFAGSDNGDVFLMALRRISGCVGGDNGEEITVDYWQASQVLGLQRLEGEK